MKTIEFFTENKSVPYGLEHEEKHNTKNHLEAKSEPATMELVASKLSSEYIVIDTSSEKAIA